MKAFVVVVSIAALILPALLLIFLGLDRGVEAAALMRGLTVQALFGLALLYLCSEPEQKGRS